MRVPRADFSKLKETRWHEYLVRFVFGGLVTVGAGWVAKQFGPSVGGLFLAFPSIFPASITLVQQHEERKHPGSGNEKGKQKAGMSSAGALAGSFGMLAFGVIVWRLADKTSPWLCLPVAFAAWFAASVAAWAIQQKLWPSVDDEQAQEFGFKGDRMPRAAGTSVNGS